MIILFGTLMTDSLKPLLVFVWTLFCLMVTSEGAPGTHDKFLFGF